MDKFKFRQQLLLITYAILLFMALVNLDRVLGMLQRLVGLGMPFICGFILAFLLNIPYRFFSRVYGRLAEGRGGKARGLIKGLALATTYLAVLMGVALLSWFVLPQLGRSVNQLVREIPGYIISLQQMTIQLVEWIGVDNLFGSQMESTWLQLLQKAGEAMSNVLPQLLNMTARVTTGVYNWVIGVIVSIYLLSGKERLLSQARHTLKALAPKGAIDPVMEVSSRANRIFTDFITGQLLDAAIVGSICFLGMTVLRMPYALLISVIVAVTNIIPMFGPYIGTIPSAFILLMSEPVKALWFVVFMVVLQQIDGNLILPRIVGGSIGLPGIWVLFAIIVGGGMFGLAGMVIGVPTFAVIYSLIKDLVYRQLNRRGYLHTVKQEPDNS